MKSLFALVAASSRRGTSFDEGDDDFELALGTARGIRLLPVFKGRRAPFPSFFDLRFHGRDLKR
jgi:hypothetical protein